MTLSTPDIERLKGLLEKARVPFDPRTMQGATYTKDQMDRFVYLLSVLPALLSDRADLEAEVERLKSVGVVCGNGALKELRDELAMEYEAIEDGHTAHFTLGFLRRVAGHRCGSEGGLAYAESRTKAAEAKVADLEGENARLKDECSADSNWEAAAMAMRESARINMDRANAAEAENARLRARAEALEEGLRLIGATADYRKDAPLNFRLEERLADIATDARALLHEGEK